MLAPAPTQPRNGQTPPATGVRTIWILLTGVVLLWLIGYWVRAAELLTQACGITAAIPPTPALTVLLLLIILAPALRRLPGVRGLSTAEVVLLYSMVGLGTVMYSFGGMRYALTAMTTLQYYSTAADPIAKLAPLVPSWFAPRGEAVVRWMWEGSPAGTVPWEAWLAPAASWTALFVLLGGAILCLTLLLAERWMAHERLAFPLVRIPLEMLGVGALKGFFGNRLMWLGFGAAVALNATNMVNGVFMGGPSYGSPVYYIGSLNLSYPWASLSYMPTLLFSFQPALLGISYLVSNEVTFSLVFFFVFHKVVTLGAVMAGLRHSELPYVREQAVGGYVAMALALLWAGRGTLAEGLRGWSVPNSQRAAARPHLQWSLLGAVGGFVGVVILLSAAGMTPWLAALHVALLILVSLTYARIRAETGVPLVYVRPYGGEYTILYSALGSAPIIGSGRDLGSPTILAMVYSISRTAFTSCSGYYIEGTKLGRDTGARWGQIAAALGLALIFGIANGWLVHLVPYYEKGAITLPGGHWAPDIMRTTFAKVLHAPGAPEPANWARVGAASFGVLMTALITLTRTRLTGLPLHPVGYLLASCEYACWLFPTFIILWPLKTLLLRYGGSGAYTKAMPLFLGLAIGHLLSGGIVWGTLATVVGGPFLRWTAGAY